MGRGQCRLIVVNIARNITQHHIFAFAAALSYYFLLALFPALIALATIVRALPIPRLFHTMVGAMDQVLPGPSMDLVRSVVSDVTSGGLGTLLSFGLLAALWTCSSAFDTLIEALNVAYDVQETRSLWRTRLMAFALTLLIGLFVTVAFALSLVGPEIVSLLATLLGVSAEFALLAPIFRQLFAAMLIVLSAMGLYFLAPNAKQTFWSCLPGSVFAMAGWLLLSEALGVYFQHFSHLNKTYGVLGGGIGLLVWLYWTSFLILIGAELNAQICKLRGNAEPA